MRGEKLALDAMKLYHKKLCSIAEKAKAKCDEHLNVTDEIIAVRKEFIEIMNSGDTGPDALKKFNALKKREEKYNKILKVNLITLINAQIEAEINCKELGIFIHNLEFKIGLRG